MIVALVTAIYEAAIVKGRRSGGLDPWLLIMMDEVADIAPVRNLASWLSQCGDHGIVIATIWQSIAQIDQRYGRAARDAICAASTAQRFIPPLAEPTTAGYVSELLGEELVATDVEHRPAEDRPRPSNPRLQRSPARSRARTRVVRGPTVRQPYPAA